MVKRQKKVSETFCLRCNDDKFITVWKDLTEKEKITVSCPMCNEQRPPLELPPTQSS